MPHHNIVFLMGPTAAGKTDLAIAICQQRPCQIISVDSALVYRQMDIGTAKPDAKTLAKYPHQLINLINPEQFYSAANFVKDAHIAIDNANQQEKTALLVGGTGFYFRALEHGLSPLPASDKAQRAKLQNQLKENGVDFLYQQLKKIDPTSAARLEKTDSQRIMRALEVYRISGETLSHLQKKKRHGGLKQIIKKIILLPDRKTLHEKIEQRFLAMLDAGFIAEVEKLYANPTYHLELPAIRCVGYRQVWQYLAGHLSYDEMVYQGIVATRQLCKRQITWLRGEQNAFIINTTDVDAVLAFLNQ